MQHHPRLRIVRLLSTRARTSDTLNEVFIDYHKVMLAEGFKLNTILKRLSRQLQMLGELGFKDVDAPPLSQGKPVARSSLTEAHFEDLLSVCNVRDRAVLLMLRDTAARINEVLPDVYKDPARNYLAEGGPGCRTCTT